MDSSGMVVPFGRYVLKERLAQGGMGEVFRAVAVGEHGFEKPVVVKRVLPSHAGRDDLTDLFVAEAKLMMRLSHPNIVGVLDFGRGDHKDYYLVLELVEGTDLGRLLRAYTTRSEPFPIPLALLITSQVLRGLHHAHTRSAGEGTVVVHRDVSPSNVLLSTEGEVKVADFGVALVTGAGGEGGAGIAGKPGYMAPEQIDGGTVDPRADVFSAAVVLHQMLTGELPFQGKTLDEQQAAARRGDRVPARSLRPEVSEAVEAILDRALAPSPGARFPDARAMAQAIEALRDQGQRLASGDDLAEAVRAAQRDLPQQGRRVIALSSPAPAEPVPSSDEAPSELTRTGGPGGVGAFTLRFPVRADATTHQADGSPTASPSHTLDPWSKPEPRTERIALDERPAPPEPMERRRLAGAPSSDPKVLRRGAIAAVLAAALLAVLAFATRTQPSPAEHVPSAQVVPSASAPEPVSLPTPSAVPVVVSSAPAPRVSGRLPGPRLPPSGVPTATPQPAATVTATATAGAAADELCTGNVTIKSEGAWVVSGGPRAVESPMTGVWRCGSYALTARSRLDPTQVKRTTISVGAQHQAVWDLR